MKQRRIKQETEKKHLDVNLPIITLVVKETADCPYKLDKSDTECDKGTVHFWQIGELKK